MILAASLFAALALVLGACAEEDGGGGTQAADCSSEGLQQAIGTTKGRRNDFKLASAKQDLAQAKETVKLGWIGDITGGNASLLVSSRETFLLAVKQANEAGDLPVNIETVVIDNKDAGTDPAPTRGLVQRFIDDPAVLGIVGPAFSGETDVGGGPLNAAGLTFMTPSATRPDLTTKGWEGFFRGLGNDFVQGGQTGQLLKALGCEKVAVVNDKSPYGAGLGEAVPKSVRDAGLEVVLEEGIEPTTNYTSVADSVIAEDHDVLYYAGYESEAPLLLKQYRDKGGEGLFIGGDGLKGDNFLKEGGEDAEGAIVTCPCTDANTIDTPEAKEYVSAYQEEYGKEPGLYSAEAWDVTRILIDAIEDGGVNATRASVREYVTNLKDYKGVSKVYNWTENREPTDTTTWTYAVRDGKYVFVGKIADIAEAD
jgi:branched-chain amino acid transport system substrate-binding protein